MAIHWPNDHVSQGLGSQRLANFPSSVKSRGWKHPDDETFPGLLLLRLEDRIFFVNAEHIAQKIKAAIDETQPKIVAIDLRGVPDLEYTALKMLIEGEKRYRERGVRLLAGWSEPTRVITFGNPGALFDDSPREMPLNSVI